MSEWIKLFETDTNFELLTKVVPTEGNLVYEYNPFRNYRLTENKYYYDGAYYSLEELSAKYNIGLSEDEKSWQGVPTTMTDPILYEKGQLVDFITDDLHFSLDHPVHIIPQASYDGSVNLIINDGINVPRMINSRFSATGKNTYKVVDRKGNNDTNIYDSGDSFNIDTSLYKRVIKIPKIQFQGVNSGGNLKVGNYHFYFKLSDADGNETDFIGESGLVSVFIGFNDYFSVTTGQKNENSFKSVNFQLSNIDSAYDYVSVYYSRSTAEGQMNEITEYKSIDKKYLVNNSGICNIIITGFENESDITASDINLNYNIVDAAKTSATCQNMLFLGNVHKPDIPYKELSDLSLRFLPYLKEEEYAVDITHDYHVTTKNKGYIDPQFIYEKTGYWGNEIYRFGIVYILNNGELSPVFNIRGRNNVTPYSDNLYSKHKVFTDENPMVRNYIEYNEETFLIKNREADLENVKGVVRFTPNKDTNTIYSVDIRVDDATIQELKKYVKGYFFVRQTRIPTILAQGVTIGIDKESGIPTIPTADGFLTDLKDSLSKTHVTTEDINGVNFISEGFLKRYSFKFAKKKSGIFKSVLKAIGMGVALVGLAAATVFTLGAAGVIATGAVVGTVAAGASAITTVAGGLAFGATGVVGALTATGVAAGIVGGAVGAVGGVVGGLESLAYQIQGAVHKDKLKLDGRNTQPPPGYKTEETEDSRELSQEFLDRFIPKDENSNVVAGIICPDYELNQAYYNQIFTGNTHLVELTKSQSINRKNGFNSNYFTNDNRHFYAPSYYDQDVIASYNIKIMPVPDNTKCVGIDDMIFRSRAGEAEEAWRYECIGTDYKSEKVKATGGDDEETQSNKEINTDIVRGSFGAYLALGLSNNKFQAAENVNIYIPEYSLGNMSKYFYLRMVDNTTFTAITDRFDIYEADEYLTNKQYIGNSKREEGYSYNAYRGDCYLCQFTHRVNRNFNDPSAPYNDEIVDVNTWKDNYDVSNVEKYEQINLGDVNAVQLGMWVTFKLRSSNNLNIRTLDGSNVDEAAMTGHPRGYYPYHKMSVEGSFKHPESEVYNKGFKKSVSERWNFELPDVPHIKNWFGTRIMYSDIHINDAYKNGFRVFKGTNYRDYTRQYGEIVKLVPFESSLLCIFEHGIALIPVNERAVAGQGAGGNVYINTSNVLPENPKIISDMFGSQWPESILKVPGKTGDSPQYVYGVDTIAKKIWRTNGHTVECISDFKVQEFLNNNITLGERELTPKIGIRNVKTHYNANKRDVMFTFYDDTYGFEEKVWNLCWNELLQKFVTFYSWVPSYMENINNTPFSFNRDTSKWIAKLGTSHSESSFADGITLTNVIIEDTYRIDNNNNVAVKNTTIPIKYLTKEGKWKTLYANAANVDKFIAGLSLSNRILPDAQVHYRVDFSLERDVYNNYKLFEIKPLTTIYTDPATGIEIKTTDGFTLPSDAMFAGAFMPLYALFFNSDVQSEYLPVYYQTVDSYQEVLDSNGDYVYTYKSMFKPEALYSELYYRNSAGNAYADYDTHKLGTTKINQSNIPDHNIVDLEDLAWVESNYPPETVIGNTSTKYYQDNPPKYVNPCTTVGEIRSLITYRDGKPYVYGILLSQHWTVSSVESDTERKVWYDLPIFKDITGKRVMLPKEQQVNPDKLVTLLNIKATISIVDSDNVTLSDTYYNMKANYAPNTQLIDAGQYESVVAIAPRWNLQFLSTDFWKHGQAGIIDITDDIYPTYWYGKQHPFEFEVIVVNDPSVHKIFDNLELVANKAKPESFHYEIIGESYDFAKDKPNMYFRQEAMKALWQYNGADICYDRNFLKVQPRQQAKSADFPHKYYTRQDTINNIEDYYINITYPKGYDYRHLSGAELVYYPTRQEFRIWNHAKAVDLNTLSQDDARSIIAANCQYLEDRWKITINPINICYKNEYTKKYQGALVQPQNSTWTSPNRPKLPLVNSPIPDKAYLTILNNQGQVEIPPVLSNLGYSEKDMDTTNWLNDVDIYKINFGQAQNRKELDIKDRFMKVRIRYSGEELAIIDFLNTIYRISYS